MQTLVAEILAAWRRAERLAAALPDESREHWAALMAAERLQNLYRDLTRIAGEVDEATAGALLAELVEKERQDSGPQEGP